MYMTPIYVHCDHCGAALSVQRISPHTIGSVPGLMLVVRPCFCLTVPNEPEDEVGETEKLSAVHDGTYYDDPRR